MAGFWGKKDGTAETLATEVESPKPPLNTAGGAAQKPQESSRVKSNEAPGTREFEKGTSGIEHFIGAGTKLKANVHFGSTALVDGQLEGDIFCMGTLIIGANGAVVGPVRCAALEVRGKYSGPAKVDQCLTIRAGGVVNGAIESGLFVVEEGGVINGDVKVVL